MQRRVLISGGLILFISLLTVAGVLFLVKMDDRNEVQNNNTISRVYVDILEIVPKTYTRWVEAYSTVTPFRKGIVSSQASGPIVLISARAEPGAQFQKGQELARIEDTRYQLALQKARATIEKLDALLAIERNENEKRTALYGISKQRLLLAQSDYERNLELFKKGIVAKKTLENAENELELRRTEYERARSDTQSREARIESIQADLASARAEINRLQEDLADTVIRAPFAGVIGERFVEIGDLVVPSQKLFTVVEISSVKVVARFPSEFIGRIKTGISVEVTTRAYPQTLFNGTLVHIYPEADPKNRTFAVEVSVHNKRDPILLPGMFARVRVPILTLDKAISVPRDALLEDERGFYLYAVERSTGTAQRKNVVLQDLGPEEAVVKEGIRAGETVVVHGKERLQNGTPLDWNDTPSGSLSKDSIKLAR